MKCIVPNCRITGHYASKESPKIRFYKCPSMRKLWVEILNISGQLSNNSWICSRHFRKTDIVMKRRRDRSFKFMLSPTAIPLAPTPRSPTKLARTPSASPSPPTLITSPLQNPPASPS
uniref:THAP-type domain-containing protein n=1 Tax=Lutzomyia longipalpis TaxID=7200 RepID=A0A1B0CEY9_LUTLO